METEIKYRLCSITDVEEIFDNHLVAIHTMPDSRLTRKLKNTYYDTSDRKLNLNKAIYRIREIEDGEITATIKISRSVSDGLHQRQEWILEQDSEEPDLKHFVRKAESDGDPDDSLFELINSFKDEELVEVCQVEFVRDSIHIGYGDTLIELSFDEGVFRVNKNEEEFSEIEIELIEGSVVDLIEFGAELEKEFGLIPENRSKYERSVELQKRGRSN